MRYISFILFTFISSVLLAYGDPKEPDPVIPPLKVTSKDTIHDESIVIPESLDEDLDSLLTDWYHQSHIYNDTSCVGRIFDTNYPDSVYIQRLAALPSVIEMPYNQVVRSYIDLYAQKKRSWVEYILGIKNFYFPIFEEALDREGLPIELKYLPIIESGLRPTARSRAGAAGLWQFMYNTGKRVGLEINSLIDERCDPYKSTQAATKYLKQLYDIYKDWNLAIAAYNCGPGNVNKAIRRAGGKTDYWDIYFFLPKETRGYVPAFIAANYIMKYYKMHNLCPIESEMPDHSDTLQVHEMIHFQQISDNLNIPMEQLRMLNPQFRRDIIPGNVHPITLRLPLPHLYTFLERQDSITAYRSNELLVNNRREITPGGSADSRHSTNQSTAYHRVRRGETLSVIARKYHTSVSSIKRLNGLRSDRLKVGQRLAVTGHATASKHSVNKNDDRTASHTEQNSTAKGYHIVKPGETLWEIANDHPGVSAEMIKKANHLRSNNLKIGQKLRIPRG